MTFLLVHMTASVPSDDCKCFKVVNFNMGCSSSTSASQSWPTGGGDHRHRALTCLQANHQRNQVTAHMVARYDSSYREAWICDMCYRHSCDLTEFFFQCPTCRADICQKCSIEARLGATTVYGMPLTTGVNNGPIQQQQNGQTVVMARVVHGNAA